MRSPTQTLTAIQEVLSGREWDSGDLETIARIMEDAGYEIAPPDGVCDADPEGVHHVGCGCVQ